MQAYSNPEYANDPYTLPNVEIFHHEHAKRELCFLNAGHKADLYGECILDANDDCCGSGWYYQYCFPGCLPDSEPIGPFATDAEALEAAQSEENK